MAKSDTMPLVSLRPTLGSLIRVATLDSLQFRLLSRDTAQQGHRKGVHVQSSFKDLVPLANRTDVSKEAMEMVRPSEEEVQATADRTKAALEKLVNGKIKAAQPKNVPNSQGETSFMRYTPQQGGVQNQKIIKMVSFSRFSPVQKAPSLTSAFSASIDGSRRRPSRTSQV